jgi:hypothetical protein
MLFAQGFALTKSSGSHMNAHLGAHAAALPLEDPTKVLLQRVYGMAFTTADELKEWQVRHQLRSLQSTGKYRMEPKFWTH